MVGLIILVSSLLEIAGNSAGVFQQAPAGATDGFAPDPPARGIIPERLLGEMALEDGDGAGHAVPRATIIRTIMSQAR